MERNKLLEESRDRIFESLSPITQSLGSPGRLRILQVLSNQASSVENLSQSTCQTIGNTSQHLQRLLHAGLVKVERKGVSRVYSLANPHVAQLWFSLQQLASELSPEIRHEESIVAPAELCTEFKISKIFKMLKKQEAILIDVRTKEEWESTPVLFASHISIDNFEEHLNEIPKSKTVFLYCRGRYCGMANPAVRLLRKKGYEAYRLRESALEINEFANKKVV